MCKGPEVEPSSGQLCEEGTLKEPQSTGSRPGTLPPVRDQVARGRVSNMNSFSCVVNAKRSLTLGRRRNSSSSFLTLREDLSVLHMNFQEMLFLLTLEFFVFVFNFSNSATLVSAQ